MMRPATPILLVLALTAALPAGAGDPSTAEELVERSLTALGGSAAWKEIETVELRGTYTTFSSPRPFVLQRRRPDLFRFEHYQADMRITVGSDGSTVWWHNTTPFSEVDWPAEVPVAYRRGYRADALFEPPFLDAGTKGHALDFRGRSRFEGMEVFELRVTLTDGLVERWFLDAGDFLPAARMSRAGFKIFETDSYTFYSDYRPVQGVMIPHHVETEIDNLVSILDVEAVEVNVELDPAAFRLPLAAPIDRLGFLAGEWRVEVEARLLPNLRWVPDEATATFRSGFDGRVIEEELAYRSSGHPRRIRRLYAYDRFREELRVVQTDDLTAHPNLLAGNFSEGRLVLTNRQTGTGWTLRGRTVHDRLVLYDITADSFSVDADRSLDGGETWSTLSRFRYSRLRDAAP